nr:uncharacterized protein LOC129448523 [Misgurnus anguillicaudatus]
MLSVVLFMSLVYQGLSLVSQGTDFVTTFPENIAYYYTKDSFTTLKITAFYSNTEVNVTVNQTNVYNATLNSGQVRNVHFPMSVRQSNFTRFLPCVRIVSTNPITVLWITRRGDSIQSNVVQPLENLDHYYNIPFLSYNKMIGLYNVPNELAQPNSTYNTFKLIIINAEDKWNSIYVRFDYGNTYGNTVPILLKPYDLYQVYTNSFEISVLSYHVVAVLLTHPCVETTGCRCNMVVSQVLPKSQWGNTFVVPMLRNVTSTWLHVTSTAGVKFKGKLLNNGPQPNSVSQLNNVSQFVPFNNISEKSQFIELSDNSTIRVVGPGFILELIPENMFAACYLVQFNSTGDVVVIVDKDHKNDLHKDNDLVLNGWTDIENSNYSSVNLTLDGTHVIWHPYSKIGVYMFDRMDNGVLYGGSAIPLSDSPDQDGCLAISGNFSVGDDHMTWPESHQYCLNETDQLVTLNSLYARTKMLEWLSNEYKHSDFWIGLRRSLFTLDWYWQTGNESFRNVSYTLWANGHPYEPLKALCASGHLDPNKNFFWKSVPCCQRMRPVCYKKPSYFSHLTFEPLDDFPLLNFDQIVLGAAGIVFPNGTFNAFIPNETNFNTYRGGFPDRH